MRSPLPTTLYQTPGALLAPQVAFSPSRAAALVLPVLVAQRALLVLLALVVLLVLLDPLVQLVQAVEVVVVLLLAIKLI